MTPEQIEAARIEAEKKATDVALKGLGEVGLKSLANDPDMQAAAFAIDFSNLEHRIVDPGEAKKSPKIRL